MIIPNTWKNKKCSKPPTSIGSGKRLQKTRGKPTLLFGRSTFALAKASSCKQLVRHDTVAGTVGTSKTALEHPPPFAQSLVKITTDSPETHHKLMCIYIYIDRYIFLNDFCLAFTRRNPVSHYAVLSLCFLPEEFLF